MGDDKSNAAEAAAVAEVPDVMDKGRSKVVLLLGDKVKWVRWSKAAVVDATDTEAVAMANGGGTAADADPTDPGRP